jgi:hypothetical protein
LVSTVIAACARARVLFTTAFNPARQSATDRKRRENVIYIEPVVTAEAIDTDTKVADTIVE